MVEEINALWKLFRHAGDSGGVCRDICFQHILPRLNATDIKFLYKVNPETRKLIKRSSRKRDLRFKFEVEEMSSISTLEVAWEHYPWGTLSDKRGIKMEIGRAHV